MNTDKNILIAFILNLGFSIFIYLLYTILLLMMTIYKFNKKEINNV